MVVVRDLRTVTLVYLPIVIAGHVTFTIIVVALPMPNVGIGLVTPLGRVVACSIIIRLVIIDEIGPRHDSLLSCLNVSKGLTVDYC